MFKPTLIVLLCGLGFSSVAGSIYAPTDDADIQILNGGNPPLNVTGVTSARLIAGCAGAVGQDRCAVIPIQGTVAKVDCCVVSKFVGNIMRNKAIFRAYFLGLSLIPYIRWERVLAPPRPIAS